MWFDKMHLVAVSCSRNDGCLCPAAVPDFRCAVERAVREGMDRLAAGEIRGALLQRLRGEAGLTRSEVARRVGVWDSASVAAWERGRQQPAPVNVPLLAAALGVEPLDLFEVTDTPCMSVLRRAAGLTLTQLAATAGMSYARCQRIEKGLIDPCATDVARLASALGTAQKRVRAAVLVSGQTPVAATRNPSTNAGP